MSDNREAVAAAMCALGEAWRGDWSDFDGRTLRHQLEDLAKYLSDTARETNYEDLCVLNDVCPVSKSWGEWCRETTSPGSCAHIDAIHQAHLQVIRARDAAREGQSA